MKKNRRYFETEYVAKQFAEHVHGTFRVCYLPGYMHMETAYLVEWED